MKHLMQRAALVLAVAVVVAWPALAAAPEPGPADPDPAERARVEQILRDYLLANPEFLLEVQRRASEKALRQAIASNRAALEKPYAAAAIGPAEAQVTIVEFMDYGCGFCRQSAGEIDRVLAADSRVRLVLRHLPILSELSAQAARVGLLAAEKGDFAAYHRRLYAEAELTNEAVLAAARAAGLGEDEALAAATDTARDHEFALNEGLAAALGASGTPAFVIGDEMFSGAMGEAALAAAVARAAARSPRTAGAP